jgi:hypothetical protein
MKEPVLWRRVTLSEGYWRLIFDIRGSAATQRGEAAGWLRCRNSCATNAGQRPTTAPFLIDEDLG